ncbi:MAG: ABC transporter permease, partial [Hyphomicrobiales bacterium]
MEWIDGTVVVLVGAIRAGTPLVFAAIGELVTERSGVLNLGVEGMMLVGAVTGFIVTVITGDAYLGVLAAMLAGVALSLVFGFLTLFLMTNQVATGLALTIFGVGFSAFIGVDYIGTPIKGIRPFDLPWLAEIPVLGPLLFSHDLLIYASVALIAGVVYFLFKTRAGLILRAVGESHDAAHAIGYRVVAIRMGAVMFGGACSGLAGAYLALVYAPPWVEGMTAGRGWISLALVVFATWRPARVMIGAYL